MHRPSPQRARCLLELAGGSPDATGLPRRDNWCMKRFHELLNRWAWLLVIVSGVVTCLSPPVWATINGDGRVAPASAGEVAFYLGFLGFELSPFLALAAISRRMAWWVSVPAAIGCAAFMLATVRDVAHSHSSTAAVALFFAPLLVLFAVLVLLGITEAVRVLRSWIKGRGRTIGQW
jgi:hypothetical protein